MIAHVNDDPFSAANASAARLTAKTGAADIAVVLGSGWTPAADLIGAADAEIPMTELGGFPAPSVPGHTPTVRSVRAGTRRVLVFLGRVHLYEGLPPAAVRLPRARGGRLDAQVAARQRPRRGPRDRGQPGG